jgi:hypothetical protein
VFRRPCCQMVASLTFITASQRVWKHPSPD